MCMTCEGKWYSGHGCEKSCFVVFNPYNRNNECDEAEENKREDQELEETTKGEIQPDTNYSLEKDGSFEELLFPDKNYSLDHMIERISEKTVEEYDEVEEDQTSVGDFSYYQDYLAKNEFGLNMLNMRKIGDMDSNFLTVYSDDSDGKIKSMGHLSSHLGVFSGYGVKEREQELKEKDFKVFDKNLDQELDQEAGKLLPIDSIVNCLVEQEQHDVSHSTYDRDHPRTGFKKVNLCDSIHTSYDHYQLNKGNEIKASRNCNGRNKLKLNWNSLNFREFCGKEVIHSVSENQRIGIISIKAISEVSLLFGAFSTKEVKMTHDSEIEKSVCFRFCFDPGGHRHSNEGQTREECEKLLVLHLKNYFEFVPNLLIYLAEASHLGVFKLHLELYKRWFLFTRDGKALCVLLSCNELELKKLIGLSTMKSLTMEYQSTLYTLDEAFSTINFGNYQVIVPGFAGLGCIREAMEMKPLSFIGPEVKSEWDGIIVVVDGSTISVKIITEEEERYDNDADQKCQLREHEEEKSSMIARELWDKLLNRIQSKESRDSQYY